MSTVAAQSDLPAELPLEPKRKRRDRHAGITPRVFESSVGASIALASFAARGMKRFAGRRGHEAGQAEPGRQAGARAAVRVAAAAAAAAAAVAARGRRRDQDQQQREPARARARPCSTRSSASSPRPAGIRSTARRAKASWPRRSPAIHKAKPENVVLGAGSQEILKSSIRAFTSPFRPLVTAAPTFENCTGLARRMGHPVYEVKVDSQFRLDLEGMLTGRPRRGPGVPEQPEQPDGDRARREDRDRLRRARPPDLAGHGHPDRRGVSRIRHRSRNTRRRFRWRWRRRTSSSRARSRRRTAWPACASATRSANSTRSSRSRA